MMKANNGNSTLTPFQEFSTDIERMFESLLGRSAGTATRASSLDKFAPHLDVIETDTDYLVSVDLPGVKPEEVKVEVDDGRLTISGKRETTVDENTKNVHRIERTRGSFSRVISLPREVDADKVDARYEQGVLHITLPKLAEKQPRKIEIRSGN